MTSNQDLRTKMSSSNVLKTTWKKYKKLDVKDSHVFGQILKAEWELERKRVIHFNTVYLNHYDSVLNYVKMRLNYDLNYSENVTNDIFVKVANNLKKYDPNRAKISTWIGKITNTTIIDFFRSNKHYTKFSNIENYQDSEGNEFFQIESSYNDENVESKQLSEKIEASILKLNPTLQKISKMYFIEELKYIEISELLNIPMGSVKGYISVIRKHLQKNLKNVYV